MRFLGAWLLLLVLTLPLAAATTIALLPAWSWFEGRWGIEAVGHSGPATWCYVSTYLAWAGLLGSGWAWWTRRGGVPPAGVSP